MINKINIAVVDDNPINLNTFKNKIAQFQEFNLIIVSNSGDSFLEELKGLPLEKQPKIVFMDIEMPKLNGIETIRIAKALYSHIQFIVLTVYEDETNIFEAIKAGATGYLLKHDSDDSIRHAIVEVIEFNGAPMSPAIARKTLSLLERKDNITQVNKTSILDSILTERENQVLKEMVHGYDAKRIAENIGISTLTVRKHIANIYVKLHVNSKAQIISMAHKNNWL